VDELRDSGGIVADGGALRERLAADGYLFFRGLLPAERIRAAAAAVTARLRDGGWLSVDGTPSAQPRAVNALDALGDPAFRAALICPEFNQIPYLPALRQTARRVLGPQAFSYPAKVLRAVYPERAGERPRGRYIHYDYAVGGGQDMLTSWLPLVEIPVRLGGLAVQPGGHHWPPQRPRPLAASEPGWATASYQPGDVIFFHCLTPHAALANTTGPDGHAALRLSGDFRWQLPDKPAPAEMVLGPAARRQGQGQGQVELFSRLFGRERWWEPIPAGLSMQPRSQLAAIPPGPSRFFAVHPGWQAWQPPPPAVH
jgi:Phytanoyl-CoA dioxygenase (PhyH)